VGDKRPRVVVFEATGVHRRFPRRTSNDHLSADEDPAMTLRLAYFCMESVFALRPLEALLAAGHDVRFLLRPIGPLESRREPVLRRHRGFDLALRRLLGLREDVAQTSPFALAADRDIPAWLCGNASTPAVASLLRRERVDLIVVAFFNQLLRPSLLAVPPLGAVNLHPSLLPAYRGPAPLFWTFKDGATQTGLTLHRIAPGEDDGDILRRLPIDVPLGTPGETLVDTLADAAHAHIAAVIDDVAAGRRGEPQDHAAASRAPRPTDADLVLDATSPARRLFHFARGVGRWNSLVAVTGDGARRRVLDAVDFDEGRVIPGEHAVVGDVLHLGCADGVIRLRVRA
jgi:methionyl-tRNA formyltransferase